MVRYLIFLILFLSACTDKELVSGLKQDEASQISLKLGEYGISSQIKSVRAVYSLQVNSRDLYESRLILNKLGLPKENELKFEDVIKQSGLLPNSRKIEQLRLDYALSKELEETLSAINWITKSKVLVKFNSLEPGIKPSIFIVVEGKNIPENSKELITNIISKAFPTIEQIEVLTQTKEDFIISREANGKINDKGEIISYPLVPFFIWKLPVGVNNELGLVIIILTSSVFSLGIFLGWVIFKYKNLIRSEK